MVPFTSTSGASARASAVKIARARIARQQRTADLLFKYHNDDESPRSGTQGCYTVGALPAEGNRCPDDVAGAVAQESREPEPVTIDSMPPPFAGEACCYQVYALLHAVVTQASKIASMILEGMLSLEADDAFARETFCQSLRSRISSVIEG